jgi:hypothetical protein
MNEYILTFEMTSDGDELEIHATKEGLEELKSQIESILEEDHEHTHLRTPNWGGHELSEAVQKEGNKIINHVKIFKW